MTGAALLLLVASPAPRLVDAAARVPDAVLDLRYAGDHNPAGRALYPAARCLLLEPVAGRLARAAAALRAQGFRLVLWDCYRPLSVQRELWRLRPDRRWVADPEQGSHHSRGIAVDVSLATPAGEPVEMPTDHDAFERRARPDVEEGVPAAARAHRALLRGAMEAAGFRQNRGEWWHYDAAGLGRHPLLDLPIAGPGAP